MLVAKYYYKSNVSKFDGIRFFPKFSFFWNSNHFTTVHNFISLLHKIFDDKLLSCVFVKAKAIIPYYSTQPYPEGPLHDNEVRAERYLRDTAVSQLQLKWTYT